MDYADHVYLRHLSTNSRLTGSIDTRSTVSREPVDTPLTCQLILAPHVSWVLVDTFFNLVDLRSQLGQWQADMSIITLQSTVWGISVDCRWYIGGLLTVTHISRHGWYVSSYQRTIDCHTYQPTVSADSRLIYRPRYRPSDNRRLTKNVLTECEPRYWPSVDRLTTNSQTPSNSSHCWPRVGWNMP